MSSQPDISFVVPAHDAAATIGRTLESVFAPAAGEISAEVIVVDDGSDDGPILRARLADHPEAILVSHEENLGMVAARNTAISRSTGAVVTILDADDVLVPDWPTRFRQIRSEWPEGVEIVFSACTNQDGKPTVRRPGYRGPLTYVDFLREELAGEYLPLFNGEYIRARGYVDLGTRRSCGALSYLGYLQDGPFWVTPVVMRIYTEQRAGSVSETWARPEAARERLRCVDALLARFGADYEQHAPRQARGLHLRRAVYARLAGEPGALSSWRMGAHRSNAGEAFAALALLGVGRRTTRAAVGAAKRLGLVKRYG